jgi:transposase
MDHVRLAFGGSREPSGVTAEPWRAESVLGPADGRTRGAGLTGAPDESGAKRRDQGLAKAGNARVPHGSSPWAEGPRGMIQLAYRFLRFQKNSALGRWYQARTADRRGATRKIMIVGLARKLLIALSLFVTSGATLEGVVLRPAG